MNRIPVSVNTGCGLPFLCYDIKMKSEIGPSFLMTLESRSP
jgi:hypothetical protein